MLGYIGSLIALAGAIVGLLGETYDKRNRGWRRLTKYGWSALAVVLIGFAISVVTNYQQRERDRKLQAAAAQEIEGGWRGLMYPFTLMLWETEGHSVGYADKDLRQLLDPKTFSAISEINIRGDAPHYAGAWRAVLSDSSRRGKQALENAQSRFNTFLDEQLIVDMQKVLTSPYLDVLTVSDSAIDQLDGSPTWAGKPYPLRTLHNPEDCKKYISSLLALHEEVEKHLTQDKQAD